MSLLSRTEEIVLLTIWQLKDNAYGVTIADRLTETTGKTWRIGAIYIPLERLEKKGYLTSYLGKATNKRGGRSKRLYRVTKIGIDALIKTKKMEENIWKDIPVVSLEGGYEK